MLSTGSVVRVTPRLVATCMSWSLAVAALLALSIGATGVARAEKECPPACVKCRANGGAWYNSFCFYPIKADVNTIETIEVEDPVLVV